MSIGKILKITYLGLDSFINSLLIGVKILQYVYKIPLMIYYAQYNNILLQKTLFNSWRTLLPILQGFFASNS